MKVRTLASIVALLLAGLIGAASAQDAKPDAKSGPPQLTFHVTPNFLKLPDNFYMAEVVGESGPARRGDGKRSGGLLQERQVVGLLPAVAHYHAT